MCNILPKSNKNVNLFSWIIVLFTHFDPSLFAKVTRKPEEFQESGKIASHKNTILTDVHVTLLAILNQT